MRTHQIPVLSALVNGDFERRIVVDTLAVASRRGVTVRVTSRYGRIPDTFVFCSLPTLYDQT
jgi:hypothetical protein